MNSINAVSLSGNITRDLEVKQVTDKFAVGNTALAVNKSYKVGEEWKTETAFIDLKIRGDKANRLKDKLKKGCPVYIFGALVQERWEKDGAKFSRVVVDVENIIIHGVKAEASETSEASAPTPGSTGPDGFSEDVPW